MSENTWFAQLFEDSFDAICFLDERFEITKANRSFLDLFKLSDTAHISFNSLFFNSEVNLSPLTLLNDEENYTSKAKLRSMQGDIIQAKISISKLLDDTKTKFLIIIHDNTKLEQAKLKIHDTEKNDLIQRMARIIGHEIRNPLTNIDLAADDLKLDFEDNSDVTFMLDLIHRNSKRISKLIDSFLLNTMYTSITLHENVLEQIIFSALKRCEDRLTLKHIELSLKGLEFETKMLLDAEKLEIVFTNVIINATEALDTTDQPKICIELSSVDNRVVLMISDNGDGMTEEVQENLFKPFYSSKQGGLGLGMSNAKHILYKHNAYFDVESKLGEGTTFFIAFDSNRQT